MKAAKKRNVYSPEFKAKVGLEALRGMKTINEIGQEYGVHPGQQPPLQMTAMKRGPVSMCLSRAMRIPLEELVPGVLIFLLAHGRMR